MPGWRVMHLLYLGGAIVSLYQNGGCNELVKKMRSFGFSLLPVALFATIGETL